MAGFCSLREFNFDHSDLWKDRPFLKFLSRKISDFVTGAEVARPYLPNEVAPALLVVRAESALAGVVIESSIFCAEVERQDGVF